MERIFIGGRGSGKTTGQIIMLMSEGNPGCMQFLAELMRTEGGQEAMLALAEYGILGSRAYQLWNDCCGRDTKKAVEILSLAKEKKITHEELCDHVDLPYGKPFDIEEIRKRDPKPEVMCHKLRVEMNPMMRGLPGMEKMQMDRMYGLLMERLFKNSDDIEGYDYVGDQKSRKQLRKKRILLQQRKEQAEALELRITQYINSISDSGIRRMIDYKYIEGYTWEKIGRIFHCDRTTAEKRVSNYLKEHPEE